MPDVSWTQFRGNLLNSGFHLVRSRFAVSPVWTAEPLKITTSSPVVGTDAEGNEVVYIGASDGKFVAINGADGSEKWNLFFGGLGGGIFSAAAVAKNRCVYFTTTARPDAGRGNSFLHKADEVGKLVWSFFEFPDHGVTFSSPKVIEFGGDTLILIYVAVHPESVQGELFVLRDRENGPELLDRKELGFCEHAITGGPSIFDLLKTIWDFYTDIPVEFDPFVTTPIKFIDPTVAILAQRQRPLIAIADNLCSIGAYEWDGTSLDVLWRRTHDFTKHSSPTITGNGFMVFGRENGTVLALDVESGDKIWEYDAGESVVATPAAAPGQFIFVVSLHHLHVINASDGTVLSDGEFPRKLKLDGATMSSPAVTANRVYVPNNIEMSSFSYNLRMRGHDPSFLANTASSVAVGQQGSVFAVRRDGRLVKYPASG